MMYEVLDCTTEEDVEFAWCIIDVEVDDIDYAQPYVFFDRLTLPNTVWEKAGRWEYSRILPRYWEFA